MVINESGLHAAMADAFRKKSTGYKVAPAAGGQRAGNCSFRAGLDRDTCPEECPS